MEDNELEDTSVIVVGDRRITIPPATSAVSAVTTNTVIINNPITNDDIESILDEYVCNEVLIEHRVQEQELLQLKTDNPNFVDSIKETIAKDMARELVKKISFTKKYDASMDVHNFRGRAWVFTKEDLYEFIKKVREDV